MSDDCTTNTSTTVDDPDNEVVGSHTSIAMLNGLPVISHLDQNPKVGWLGLTWCRTPSCR